MEWQISSMPVHYPDAVAAMENRVREIISGQADELVWLLEHPPLYTAGTGAKEGDLLDSGGFPVYKSGRGGQYTYHGPGQRIAYVMLDLRKRNPDVRDFVKRLETCVITALAAFGVRGGIREGRVGVWVEERVAGSGGGGEEGLPLRFLPLPPGEAGFVSELQANLRNPVRERRPRVSPSPNPLPEGEGFPGILQREKRIAVRDGGREEERPVTESKIAAIGVRIRKWVTYHGVSVNINPDLGHYDGIVPCGIKEYGVTSLARLGVDITADAFDREFMNAFLSVIG